MNIRIRNGFPYVAAALTYRGQHLPFDNILLDTGSAGTVFAVDKVLAIGIQLEPQDLIRRIRGVGGAEFVFIKSVDRLSLDDLFLENFEIEVGAMNYGIESDGILGMDFLLQVGAGIDLAQLKIYRA